MTKRIFVKYFNIDVLKDGVDLDAFLSDGTVRTAAVFDKMPSAETWHAVADELCGLVEEAARADVEDGENYGLSFYACGYDGQAQQEFIQSFKEKYGAYIF